MDLYKSSNSGYASDALESNAHLFFREINVLTVALVNQDRENNTEKRSPGLKSEKEALLIGIISTFLHVHPFGANIEYLWSYMQQLDSKMPKYFEKLVRDMKLQIGLKVSKTRGEGIVRMTNAAAFEFSVDILFILIALECAPRESENFQNPCVLPLRFLDMVTKVGRIIWQIIPIENSKPCEFTCEIYTLESTGVRAISIGSFGNVNAGPHVHEEHEKHEVTCFLWWFERKWPPKGVALLEGMVLL
ncbi:hypothetical protein STEG23_016369, partial [Scotinomys teguina]